MRTHRTIRIVASILLIAALVVFLIGLVLAIALGTGGLGDGWGLGWRGWAWLPLLLSMLGSVLTMAILGVLLVFLPKIEQNMAQARANRNLIGAIKAKKKVSAKVEAKLPAVDADLSGLKAKAPSVKAKAPDVKASLAGAGAAVGLSGVDIKKPDLGTKAPKLDVDLPKIETKVSDLAVDLPDVDVDLPDVDLPDVDVDLPHGDIDLPDLELDALKLETTSKLSDRVSALQTRLADMEAQGVTFETDEPGGDLRVAGSLPGAAGAAKIADELNAIREVARGRRRGDADDLQIVKGIGPVYSKRLRERGVRTFAELATVADEILEEVTEGNVDRAARDNWLGQARMLSR